MDSLLQNIIVVLLALVAAILAGLLTWLAIYIYIIMTRLKNREKQSMEMVTLEVKILPGNRRRCRV